MLDPPHWMAWLFFAVLIGWGVTLTPVSRPPPR
jgi:hypothetical protein